MHCNVIIASIRDANPDRFGRSEFESFLQFPDSLSEKYRTGVLEIIFDRMKIL